jgi:sterol desaturase/sphingolipid hydroxylase (fatty acid hydroxylase superfamily)
MNWSIWSPVIITGAALIFIACERFRPYSPGQRFLRDEFWLDFLFYGLLQSFVLALVIGRLIAAVDAATGWSRSGVVSSWPVWVQVVFFTVSHDLYIYAFHRCQHRSRYLWRIHEAHHSVRDVDWVGGLRSHPVEILINQSIEFGPMILLGAAPEVPLIKGVVSGVWGMWIHANIDVHSGVLQYLINGPEMHRWHHARELPPEGRNFATKLAIWDHIFGTAVRPNQKPESYGLFVDNDPFPRGYLRQVLAAFRPFARARAPQQRETRAA